MEPTSSLDHPTTQIDGMIFPAGFLPCELPPRNTKKKGSSVRRCPYAVPRGGTAAIAWPGLRQVIAKGGKDHVVNGLGIDAWSARRESTAARPTVANQVRILDAPAQTTLRTLIRLVPEPDGAFLNVAEVACARAVYRIATKPACP